RYWLPARSDELPLPQTRRFLVSGHENDSFDRRELAGDQGCSLHHAKELGRPHRDAGLPHSAEDLRILAADANYSWSALREECRGESTRPLIKHREQTPLQKAHNARMDADAYNQRWMSETQHLTKR